MKKAIAMVCTEEQFALIKPKLKLLRIESITCFKNSCYLTNNLSGIYGIISNVNENQKINYGREIHETWNEKVFLSACGIETEREYVITREQIRNLNTIANSQTRDAYQEWFPEAFKEDKVELEVGKWYKSESCGGSLFYLVEFSPNKKDAKGYGFEKCEWYDRFSSDSFYWSCEKIIKEATPEEVTKALTKEAVKRGYEEGVWINRESMHANTDTIEIPKGNKYLFDCNFNILYLNEREIFSNGKWAEIIPTISRKDAEKQLGKKFLN